MSLEQQDVKKPQKFEWLKQSSTGWNVYTDMWCTARDGGWVEELCIVYSVWQNFTLFNWLGIMLQERLVVGSLQWDSVHTGRVGSYTGVYDKDWQVCESRVSSEDIPRSQGLITVKESCSQALVNRHDTIDGGDHFRNFVTGQIRQLKKHYCEHKFNVARNDTKQSWRIVSNFINTKNRKLENTVRR